MSDHQVFPSKRMLVLVAFGLGLAMMACGPQVHRIRYYPLSVTVRAPNHRPVPRPQKIKISERIQFKQGSARLRSRSYRVLDHVAETLRARPDIKLVEIQGHTDSKGHRRKNLRLSHRRAERVRDYLINKGIAASRLICRGQGPDHPITTNHTRSGRRSNRRVEFIILKRHHDVTAQGA